MACVAPALHPAQCRTLCFAVQYGQCLLSNPACAAAAAAVGSAGQGCKPCDLCLQEHLHDVLPSILDGLADEAEGVRDAALAAGGTFVDLYAETALPLLLPAVEDGILNDNWRISGLQCPWVYPDLSGRWRKPSCMTNFTKVASFKLSGYRLLII